MSRLSSTRARTIPAPCFEQRRQGVLTIPAACSQRFVSTHRPRRRVLPPNLAHRRLNPVHHVRKIVALSRDLRRRRCHALALARRRLPLRRVLGNAGTTCDQSSSARSEINREIRYEIPCDATLVRCTNSPGAADLLTNSELPNDLDRLTSTDNDFAQDLRDYDERRDKSNASATTDNSIPVHAHLRRPQALLHPPPALPRRRAPLPPRSNLRPQLTVTIERLTVEPRAPTCDANRSIERRIRRSPDSP